MEEVRAELFMALVMIVGKLPDCLTDITNRLTGWPDRQRSSIAGVQSGGSNLQ